MNIVEQIRQLLSQLFQWWVTVTPWQQCVRVRCGKHATLLTAGMHWKLPVLDTIYLQPVRLRAQYIEPQTVTTADGRSISLSVAVHYRIADLLKLYNTIHNQSDTISQTTQGEVAGYVSGFELGSLNKASLELYLTETLHQRIDPFGLEVVEVQVTNFAVVKTYRLISGSFGPLQSFHDKMVKEEK